MKTIKTLIGVAALLLATISTQAQTTSPVIDAVNTVAVDTNSDAFARSTFDIRSGYNSAKTQADVGADYNLFAHWQLGADFGFATGANVLSTAQVNGMYRIPIHNMEFDGGLTAGFDWDNSKAYIGAIGRFSYLVSQSTGITAFVQPQVTEVFIRSSKPTIGVMVGIGKSF